MSFDRAWYRKFKPLPIHNFKVGKDNCLYVKYVGFPPELFTCGKVSLKNFKTHKEKWESITKNKH